MANVSTLMALSGVRAKWATAEMVCCVQVLTDQMSSCINSRAQEITITRI